MRTCLLAFITLSATSFGVSAQVAERVSDTSCRAPVALDDKSCADLMGAGSSRPDGTIEQRDDGYYVFVPRQGD